MSYILLIQNDRLVEIVAQKKIKNIFFVTIKNLMKKQNCIQQSQIDREKLPYREGVLGIVVDNKHRFLVVTHSADSNINAWRFPGGGIEKGERPEVTILREFKEEFGTNQFEILKMSLIVNQTEWPDESIVASYQLKGKWWRGQRQFQFLLQSIGNPSAIRPESIEIREMMWATIDELPSLFIYPNQWERARLVIQELLG